MVHHFILPGHENSIQLTRIVLQFKETINLQSNEKHIYKLNPKEKSSKELYIITLFTE